MTPIPASSMAGSAQLIVDAIGFDAAITLLARLGGLTVVLPLEPQARDLVASAIGVDRAKALAAALGGGQVLLPRATSWLLARRDEEVVVRAAAGETRTELALRFGLTERHVYRILAEASATNPSGDRA